MSRFFIRKEDVFDDEIVIRDQGDIHHLTHVLRLREGSVFDVSDSDKWEYKVELARFSQTGAWAKIIDKMKFAREPGLRITLFQGVPKQGKMEGIIRKSVELGVNGIVPVITARTEASGIAECGRKRPRWQKVSIEAAKQCRRGTVPEVQAAMAFSDMAGIIASRKFDNAVFPYENEEANTIKGTLQSFAAKPLTLALAIGPEGGFSDSEADFLKEAGACSVSLGKTILRTETAGPAAIAMVMYELEL